jgi:biotin carboxyl carrier protein
VSGPAVHIDRAARRVIVNLAGVSYGFDVLDPSERWAPVPGAAHGDADAIVAPFPAVVAEVAVIAGQAVDSGDPVIVIEAMKMLHTLAAAGAGTVAEIRVAPGDQVAAGQILVTFETAACDPPAESRLP